MSLFDKDIIEKEIPFRVILQKKVVDIINDGMDLVKHISVNDSQISNERYLEYYIKTNVYVYLHEMRVVREHLDWRFPVVEECIYVAVFSDFSMISIAIRKQICSKLDKDLEFTLCAK